MPRGKPQLRPGTRILLVVTGGIAAYKSAYLVRRLKERGAEVRCALTRAAEAFVTPLTLEVLTGEPVYRQEYLSANDSGEELHMTAARWADVLCFAPCTTHSLARLALGLGEDFASTVALAYSGPIVIAPAMHSEMWLKSSTQEHIGILVERDVTVVGPAEGALASGELGVGRMVEPEEIVEALARTLAVGSLTGRTVVIDAGPTREALDPVRFLSNRSTGRMGFALANEASRRGATVHLVAGPVDLSTPHGVIRTDVTSAVEMRDAVYEVAPTADIVILCAAVSDFRPVTAADQKLKKEDLGERMTVELERNPDILAGLSEVAPNALRVGFAAETRDLERYAKAKLERKDAHLLVANDVSRSDIGFGASDNEVTVFTRSGEVHSLGKQSKASLAKELFDLFETCLEDESA